MANTLEEISPSYVRRYASLHPEVWNLLIGTDVVHLVWGKCSIENIDIKNSRIYYGRHNSDLVCFRDNFFSELRVAPELATTIMAYIQKGNELDEEEWAKQDKRKLEAVQQQAKAQEELTKAKLDAQRTEHEKKQIEAIRREKIRDEAEKRRLLVLERKAEVRELESRAEKQKRAQTIQNFCRERGIRNLLHFTRLENLDSILEFGLLGRHGLENTNLAAAPIFNDEHRLDGLPDAVCLSISFPNYLLLNKFINRTNKKNWVILLLDAYILWEFDCAFFETNAASGSVKKQTFSSRKEYSSLARMFDDHPSVKRSNLGIPNYYSTDPQAEVLVLEQIPPEYISEVHFYDRTVMTHWFENHKIGCSQKIHTNSEYFNARIDYAVWLSLKESASHHSVTEDVFPF